MVAATTANLKRFLLARNCPAFKEKKFTPPLQVLVLATLLTLAVACQAGVREEGTDLLADSSVVDEVNDVETELLPESDPHDSAEMGHSNCTLDDVVATEGQFVADSSYIGRRFAAQTYNAGCIRYAVRIGEIEENFHNGEMGYTVRVCNRCEASMAMYLYTLFGNVPEAFEGEQPMEGRGTSAAADIGMVVRDTSGRRFPIGCPGLFSPVFSLEFFFDKTMPHGVNRYTLQAGVEITVIGYNEMAQYAALGEGVEIPKYFPELPYYQDPIDPDSSPLALELQLPKLYPLSVPFEDIHPEQQISIVCELSGFPQVLDTPTSLDDGPWSEDDLFFQTVEDVVLPEILMESLRARPVQP